MKVEKATLPEVLILEPQVFGDHRGWFTESYSQRRMLANGIDIAFVQDNHSFSAQKGTLRGLHFQNDPESQTKLIRCTRGRLLDVAVDIRKGSPTFRQWISVELSADNHRQLLIPKGFAHGFITLTDDVEVEYKVDRYYAPDYDRNIRYDDPDIGIEWGAITPVLSAKDQNAPLLKDSDVNFTF